MEAQLLQVSLPEIQELYQTLLAKPTPAQQTGRSSPARPSSEKVGVWRAAGEKVSGGGMILSVILSKEFGEQDVVFDPEKDTNPVARNPIPQAVRE